MRSTPTIAGTDTGSSLVHRMAAGDERALGTLYDAHGGAAYWLAKALCGNQAAAEAVVAAAFAEAWRSASEYQERTTGPRGWLLALVRRHALETRGAVGQTPMADQDLRPARAASRLDGVRTGPRAPVVRAIAALPEPERRTLELACFGGLTIDQIADALEQSKGSVLRRLRTAMQHVGRTVPSHGGHSEHLPLSRA